MLFDVREITRDGWTVVSVVGDLDLATMPALHQRLSAAAGDRVALDLSSVDLVDPVTFGVMIVASLRSQRRAGRFAVICPDGRPRELFVESGLDQILDVVSEFAEL